MAALVDTDVLPYGCMIDGFDVFFDGRAAVGYAPGLSEQSRAAKA